jgi:predicted GIY-YIG superfamily endonuclease
MFYVYILKSKIKDWRYVGYTGNLKQRLKQHNEGKTTATQNHRPFELISYVAVQDQQVALELEKYFKSGSGIAWMNKHLLPKN